MNQNMGITNNHLANKKFPIFMECKIFITMVISNSGRN